MINDNKLKKLKESINIYMNNNFDDPIKIDEVTNTDKIEVANTTLGDNEEFNIQVALDVRAMRLESKLSGKVTNKVDYYDFDSFSDMTEQLKHLQFE